jgi:hypothetical protein
VTFFISERKNHYDRINGVMYRLRGIQLEREIRQEGFPSIFQQHRLRVELPDLYLYDKACLHIKQENASLGKTLESLPQILLTHNQEVDSAETELITRLNETLTNHKLTRDTTGDFLNNLLKVMTLVWSAYNGDLVKSMDKTRLLDYFTRSIPRDDEGDHMYLIVGQTSYFVFRGSEEEKNAVIESIRTVLVDSVILNNINKLEESKSALALSIAQIAKLAQRISRAIDAGDYTTKAECCPTVWSMIHDYLL